MTTANDKPSINLQNIQSYEDKTEQQPEYQHSEQGRPRSEPLRRDAHIEKIEAIQANWQKPWFTEGSLAWPRNLGGREYNGMNTLMLLMHCEKNGYRLPVFLTYSKCVSLNYSDTPQGRVPAVGTEGEKLPWVHVLKGEKSFPVFLTTFTVKDEQGNKIKYEDYKLLSDNEKSKYKVFPATLVYDVFNVAQTNIEEARPDLYNKLKSELIPSQPVVEGDAFEFKAFDLMATEDKWICPIRIRHQDRAYFSLSGNEIVVPEKSQFSDGQSFYSTAFHECIYPNLNIILTFECQYYCPSSICLKSQDNI